MKMSSRRCLCPFRHTSRVYIRCTYCASCPAPEAQLLCTQVPSTTQSLEAARPADAAALQATAHSPQPAAHQYGQPLTHSSVELEPTKNCACGLARQSASGGQARRLAAARSRPFSWRTPPAHHARTHPQHSSRASSRTHPSPATSAIPTSSCRHQCSPFLRFFLFRRPPSRATPQTMALYD